MLNFLLAQTTTTTTSGSGDYGIFFMLYLLFVLAAVVISIMGLWKMFEKAGQPGWASIIPIYNVYVILKVAARPGWWLLLFLIPFVNFVISLIIGLDLAKKFGKSEVFGIILLGLFSGIGYIIVGFDDSTYSADA